MLTEIRIADLGVIGEAVIELGPGLTVLTGETGAGKTMVVTSLTLLLGGRADTALIRAGASRAVVEGVLDLPAAHPAMVRAQEAGADTSDGLVLVRTLGAQGRSRAHVGGRAAPVGLLAELGPHVVAVHGQADQWRLRRIEEHRDLLDDTSGPEHAAALAGYRALYAQHAQHSAELAELTEHARDRAQEAQALQRGLALIEEVDPRPGEDTELAALADRLGHLELLRSAAAEAQVLLAGDDETYAVGSPGVVGALGAARAALTRAGGVDPVPADLADRVAEVGHLVADLCLELAAYQADLEVEPGRLEQVQARRARLGELTRLYGPDTDAVLAWSAQAAQRLSTLLTDDDRIERLTTELTLLAERRARAARTLTASRQRVARELGERITAELGRLAMGRTTLSVQVRDASALGASGADEVEMMLGTPTGAEQRPLARAASGGELSRVMLAIEVAAAGASRELPTFVFDEVDAGVGGRAALAVGARLAELSAHTQVIVVTHLAQVAAHADRHLVVTKAESGPLTSADVSAVEGEARVAELARMLSGQASEAALAHARDLLATVTARRK